MAIAMAICSAEYIDMTFTKVVDVDFSVVVVVVVVVVEVRSVSPRDNNFGRIASSTIRDNNNVALAGASGWCRVSSKEQIACATASRIHFL